MSQKKITPTTGSLSKITPSSINIGETPSFKITGQNLTGANLVSFEGTAASEFKVLKGGTMIKGKIPNLPTSDAGTVNVIIDIDGIPQAKT